MSNNNSISANEIQIGGDHYKKVKGEQHWDRQWRLRGRGYFIGNITAYVERYDEKNGLEDLQKALHYIQKLIELEQAAILGTGPLPGGNDKPLSPMPEQSETVEEAKQNLLQALRSC